MVTHFFTVDVEEYFQVSAFEGIAPRSRWADFESRVTVVVERLLELLADANVQATFFTLGVVARRSPDVVKSIANAGHEIASHGIDHRRVTTITQEEFRKQARESKHLLEDLAGSPVLGYRAPSYSIIPGNEWALEVLRDEGYQYDSSLFPIRRRGYGYPDGQADPHWFSTAAGPLYEVPPCTWRVGGQRLPAAGGGYFRLLPYALVRAGLRQAARRGQPGTFYIHPWELDPQQPRLSTPLLTRVRHYTGLDRVIPRLKRLLGEFSFTSISEGLPSELPVPV